jgi:DNA (cytosine-5)-methyltransferase 1
MTSAPPLFFAGIGGWPLALQLAGWPADRPVWTGSCPCQPLSCAGLGAGHADERHLWPAFFELIAQQGPTAVFGEQVASKDGREWFAGIRADLEGVGYACGAADLCAAGVGSPHPRQRLFWVADARHQRQRMQRERETGRGESGRDRQPDRLADAGRRGSAPGISDPEQREEGVAEVSHHSRRGEPCGMADSKSLRDERSRGIAGSKNQEGRERGIRSSLGCSNFWANAAVVQCRDGKARRFEPGSFPLAHGLPGRVGLLRGYGNAIVPQVAAQFIQAFLDA